MNRDEIMAAVYEAIARANELRDPGAQIALDPATALFGAGGALDSLGLVSLVLDVEDAVNGATGRAVTLSDDRAMSQARSPFRTVSSFVDYIGERLRGPDM